MERLVKLSGGKSWSSGENLWMGMQSEGCLLQNCFSSNQREYVSGIHT